MSDKKPFAIRQPAKTPDAPPRGTVPASKASTPFSTSGGAPKVTDASGSRGWDFQQDPTGSENVNKEPTRDYVSTSGRPQQQPPARQQPPADPIARANRAQQPTSPAQRLGGAGGSNMPSDGVTHGIPVEAVPSYRRGTGSAGNERRPFKVKG